MLALFAGICFLTSWLNLYAYDDVYVVYQNPLIRSLAHWTRFFRLDYWAPFFHMGLYRPIDILSFALEWHWWPNDAGAYHITNIVLHAAVALLLFRFLRRRLEPVAAWVAAAWFASTPLHAGVVAGLVGRADLLAAGFALLALWAAEAGLRRRRWPAAMAVFPLTLLALGSKESAIVLPGLLCLMIWIEMPGAPAPLALATAAPPPAGRARRARGLAPLRQPVVWSCAAATFFYLAVRIRVVGLLVHSTSRTANPLAFAPAAARWRTALVDTGFAVRSLFWPFHLSPDYSYNQIPLVQHWYSPRLALALPLLAACGLAAWLARRNRAALLGAAWFFLAWLPVSNLLFPIGTIYANRLLYFPSLGAALALGAGWEAIWRRLRRPPPALPGRRLRLAPAALVAAALALAFIYVRTDLRTGEYWSDNSSLFAYAVRVAPNSSVAHILDAEMLAEWGHARRAIVQYRQGLLIEPENATAWVGLGQQLARRGHWRVAADCFPRALASQPRAWVFDAAAPIELRAHRPAWLLRQAAVLDGRITAQERSWLRSARRAMNPKSGNSRR